MTNQDVFARAIEAVISGDAGTLHDLLQRHPDLATARSETGKGNATLLHYVAANGVDDHHQKTPPNAVEIAKILFDAGCDPRATAGFYGGGAGSTPLVGLVSSVHPYNAGVQEAIIKVFIERGAPVNGILDDGRPLATALATRYSNAVKTLVDGGARLDNLVFAAAAGDVDQLLAMLSDATLTPYVDAHGDSISDPQSIKTHALHKASLCGQLESVRLLLNQGVDVNATDDNKQTALHEAAWAGAMYTIHFLVQQGANAGIRDRQFNSMPVHWARANGKTDAFDYLLPRSPLTIADAAEFGMIDAVHTRLANDLALVDGEAGDGAPLREAAANGHTGIVQLLLKNGANPALTSRISGKTALDLARTRGHTAIVDLLQPLQPQV